MSVDPPSESQSVGLERLGWDADLENAYAARREEGWRPARVFEEQKQHFRLVSPDGEMWGRVAGRLLFDAKGPADLPVVGDWILMSPASEGRATIHAVLPRRTKISRKAAGRELREQPIASNVDVIFLVTAATGEFSPARVERFLTVMRESRAEPVIVLNKADLADADRRAALVAELKTIAADVAAHVVSARTGEGLASLRPHLSSGRTLSLIGASGVGKSSLVNALAGSAVRTTGEVRVHDDSGRHTSSSRQMIRLPGGALVIDTPGMREIALWEAEEGFRADFADIEALALACQFRDCRHDKEPRCAVRQAADDGRLEGRRFEAYRRWRDDSRSADRKKPPPSSGPYRKRATRGDVSPDSSG